MNWNSKKQSLSRVIEKIPPGSHLFISNGSTSPYTLIETMVQPEFALVDMEIVQFLNIGPMPYLEAGTKRFRTKTFFVDDTLYQYVKEGGGDYAPLAVSAIPRLVHEELLRIDVALIKVSPPNSDGMCSLGTGVDMMKEMVHHAKLVIAEVTSHMPFTHGESLISCDDIDYWVENNRPLLNYNSPAGKDSVLQKIGSELAEYIPNGATLRIGLGEVANAVVPFLKGKKHLGLHTEVLTDGLRHLIQNGVIDNSQKNFHPGKSIVSHCLGSSDLYKFVDQNPQIEFYPLAYTNAWHNIARNYKMTTVIEAKEIDLTGQVCTESKGPSFHGGFGGTTDFIRGTMLAEEGQSFVVLRSTKNKGLSSSIVSFFEPGTGVAVTRADVHHVATEYGVARLYGKTIRERCLALIEIAHPNFRDQLLKAAKQCNYISKQQPGYSFKSRYPSEWEYEFISKKSQKLLIRPVKATDEDKVRDFFHSLSDRNIYLRYFRQLRSLPHQVLQGFVDIDYSRNMSLVVINSASKAQEIVGIGQWVMDENDNIPDLAFQIQDDWQGHGLGSYLMKRLIEIAQSYQITHLKADVLAENTPMLRVFEHIDYPITKKAEFGVITLVIEIL